MRKCLAGFAVKNRFSRRPWTFWHWHTAKLFRSHILLHTTIAVIDRRKSISRDGSEYLGTWASSYTKTGPRDSSTPSVTAIRSPLPSPLRNSQVHVNEMNVNEMNRRT